MCLCQLGVLIVVLQRYRDEAKVPLLINSCEVDAQFPPDLQAKADEILKGFAPGYERVYFAGCKHGFAVRGDIVSRHLIHQGVLVC